MQIVSTNIYEHMSDAQINEEFEKSLLVGYFTVFLYILVRLSIFNQVSVCVDGAES